MFEAVVQWMDALTPDRTELVVHVIDAAGHPVQGAGVRIVEDGSEAHAVNNYDGTFATAVAWPEAGGEIPFSEGTSVNLVVTSPRHKAQTVSWTSPGGRRDHLTVTLEPLSMRDFLAGDGFVFSQENLAQAASTAQAPLSLLSSVGRALAGQDQALRHVLDWTHLAAEETAANYAGDAYVARMWRLAGIRAVAANEELRRVSLDPAAVHGRDPDAAKWQIRRQAGRLSRDWGEYAIAAHRDASLAIDLCLAATADASYCPRVD